MTEPVLQLRDAALAHGTRRLWTGLSLDVQPGELLAVLGANGSGKTSLLRAILGLLPLTGGTVTVGGQPATQARRRIGYVRQQHRIDPFTPLRAKDVVRQGLDGHRWGFGRPRRVDWARVGETLTAVDAAALADMPIGTLSGGEQQRVRIAQALVGDPLLLLCDEPLLSLDLGSQATISALVDRQRHERGTAVVFVTHEINPVLPYVDRVLYLAGGRCLVGTVDEVFTSTTLGALYASPVEVIRRDGHILVAGLPPTYHDEHDEHHADVGHRTAVERADAR
ncbi:MAG: ATP-binding cassette domain-containing protein [Ilumatobacteraceae bacterium]